MTQGFPFSMELPADRTWLWCAALFYFAGFVLGTAGVWRRKRHPRVLMYSIILGGYALQTFGLYLRGLEVKGCPLGNSFEVFQFTAWSATSLYLVVGATFRLSLLGYFTSMLSTALTVLSLSIPAWDATRRIGIFGDNAWIEFHAALALFSYGVFALLALTSILYLLRHYSLKNKRLDGAFTFLPPILDLENINFRLMLVGVSLLSASLLVGSVWWLRDTATVNTSKILMTVAVWFAYAFALGLRIKGLLLAKRLAWVSVVLFVIALGSLRVVDASRHSVPAQSVSLPRS